MSISYSHYSNLKIELVLKSVFAIFQDRKVRQKNSEIMSHQNSY